MVTDVVDGDESPEEEEPEEDDEEEFTIFFDKEEIASTKEHQQFDAFEDIKSIKAEINMVGDIRSSNWIQIEQFAPKEEFKTNPSNQRKKTGRSVI